MKQSSAEFTRTLPVLLLPFSRDRWAVTAAGQAQRRAVPALALVAGAVPMLAAVPLGSHRPIWWMLLAIAIAGLCVIVLIRHARARTARVPLFGLPLLMALFLAGGAAQLLPLGEVLDLERQRIAIDTHATALALIRWTSYAAFFWLICHLAADRNRARTIAWTILAGVFAHAVWALVAFRFLGDAAAWGAKEHYLGAVTGTFVNRNAFAMFLGMGLVLGLGLLLGDVLRHDPRRPRMMRLLSAGGLWAATLWLCLGIIALAFFGTASRFGIFAGLMGALIVTGALAAKHSDGSGHFVARVMLWWSGATILLFALVGKPALERAIFTRIDSQDRISLYVQTIDLIRQNPLTGIGLDGFEIAFQAVHRPPLSPDLFWDRAHSTYLALWAEMGLVIGSIPPLLCAVVLAVTILRVRRAGRDFALGIVGIGVIALAGLHSLVDFSLEIAANVYLFLALVALGLTTGLRKGAS